MAPTFKIGDTFELDRPTGYACIERGIFRLFFLAFLIKMNESMFYYT